MRKSAALTAGGLVQQKTDTTERRPIELVPIEDEGTRAHQAPRLTLVALFWKYRGFGFAVFIPTVLAAVYFYAIAAVRYESESKFVVRSPAMLRPVSLPA